MSPISGYLAGFQLKTGVETVWKKSAWFGLGEEGLKQFGT